MQRLLVYRKTVLHLTQDDTILRTGHKSIRIPTNLGEMYEVYQSRIYDMPGVHWRSSHIDPSWKVLEPHRYYYNGQYHNDKPVDLFGTVQWPWGSRYTAVCGS